MLEKEEEEEEEYVPCTAQRNESYWSAGGSAEAYISKLLPYFLHLLDRRAVIL